MAAADHFTFPILAAARAVTFSHTAIKLNFIALGEWVKK